MKSLENLFITDEELSDLKRKAEILENITKPSDDALAHDARLKEGELKEDIERTFCPYCGNELEPGQKFCCEQCEYWFYDESHLEDREATDADSG